MMNNALPPDSLEAQARKVELDHSTACRGHRPLSSADSGGGEEHSPLLA